MPFFFIPSSYVAFLYCVFTLLLCNRFLLIEPTRDPFVRIPAYRILIYSACKFAYIANEANTHLRIRHCDISPNARHGILRAIQRQDVIRCRAEMALPQAARPIPLLRAPKSDGLGCILCPYISRHLSKMHAHCRSCHGWRNPRKRGRRKVSEPVRVGEVLRTTGVRCQRFFPSRAASGWFEVRDWIECTWLLFVVQLCR